MIETAAILNQATPNSIVILDEVGRGTSTWDGLAIAWAAVEHLHEVNRCRALFATHYHELTGLADTLALRQRQPAGAGMGRRSGLPARGEAGPGRPVLWRAGGQAGGSADCGGEARRSGAEAAGSQGRSGKRLEELPLFAAFCRPEADDAPEPSEADACWGSSTRTR